ncbi:MAG: HlyD family efflux transporter periplasmic adaptor subunit [Phycisphaerales bacterium]|nr:MAG: HlyD family efflux transporter periplasmic adaptor subunit [Phycisphaerales bacterium]
MIRWIILLIVVIVITAAVFMSVTSSELVDTAIAHRAAISSYIEERARTRLPRTFSVTMPIDGRILPIELDEGDPVTAGQIVAQIEPEDLETAVAQARARVRRLEASIVQNNDTRLELSMLEGINNELESIDRTVEAAEAKTEASEARQDYRATDLQRKTDAYEDQAATLKELEEARLADIESKVNYRTDVLTLRALEAIRRAAQIWPRAVNQYIDKKSLSQAVLDQELAEARAALEFAERNQQRGTIAAPTDGVVLHRAVSNTRVLPAGQPLLEIGRLENLEVEAEVLSQEAVEISVGDMVEIFGPAIGREPIAGVVSRIEPRGFTKISSLGVEQQRVRVIIAFDPEALEELRNAGRELGVEYRVRVRIHTEREEDTVVIPRSALFRSAADRWQAFVIRNGKARLTDLTIGLMNDSMVEVLEGIESDEEVILAPETSLADGTRVESRADD